MLTGRMLIHGATLPRKASRVKADLDFKQHPRWGFQRFLDALEEGDRFAAIDNAMIVGERQIHHRANNNLSVANDGAVLNGVHSQNAALRRIENRRGKQRTINSAVADREGAALQFFK